MTFWTLSFPLVKRRSNSFKNWTFNLIASKLLKYFTPSHCAHPASFRPVLWLNRETEPQVSGHIPPSPITTYFISMLNNQNVFDTLTISSAACCFIYLWYFANWQNFWWSVLRLENDSHTTLSQALSLCGTGEWGHRVTAGWCRGSGAPGFRGTPGLHLSTHLQQGLWRLKDKEQSNNYNDISINGLFCGQCFKKYLYSEVQRLE